MVAGNPQSVGGLGVEVRPIRPGEEKAAGEVAYLATRGRRPTAGELASFLAHAADLGTDLALQSVAVAEECRIVGCAMLFPMIDRTATVTPPFCAPGYVRAEVQTGLLNALKPMAAERGIQMLQCFAGVDDARAEDILTHSGFDFLATMLFLDRPVTEADRKCKLDNRIRWVAYSADRHEAFVRFVESSYEGTLDCSKLGEFRDVGLTIEGYRLRGEFDASLWLLGEVDGGPAAISLIAWHPDEASYELVYVAVAPGFRGKGLGRKAMERGLSEVALRGVETSITLVVDEANVPAVDLYRAMGFHETQRRRAYFSLLARP